jgi:hypothetical protein
MNQKHGPITFFGIEIPFDSVYEIKRLYRDKCGHPHMLNSKKAKYDYCEKCGEPRFYIEKKITDVGRRLSDRLIYTEIEDSNGHVVQKYYAVMEWYDNDVKINTAKYAENAEKREEFKTLMKDIKLWKAKRFGLFVLQNAVPTMNFYKNNSIKNDFYALSALCIDAELDPAYAKEEKQEYIIDNIEPAN